jgi:DNA-binding GntR family transcriptional regulator
MVKRFFAFGSTGFPVTLQYFLRCRRHTVYSGCYGTGKKLSLPVSLAEQAYTRILEKILRSEYPLGAALSHRKPGSQLGMSFLPRVGTRARVPTAQNLRDRHIIREALEAQSARMPPRSHQPLVDMITGTDPDVAEAAMRAHVRFGIEDIQAEIVRRFGTPVGSLDGIRLHGRQAPFRAGAWRAIATASR